MLKRAEEQRKGKAVRNDAEAVREEPDISRDGCLFIFCCDLTPCLLLPSVDFSWFLPEENGLISTG